MTDKELQAELVGYDSLLDERISQKDIDTIKLVHTGLVKDGMNFDLCSALMGVLEAFVSRASIPTELSGRLAEVNNEIIYCFAEEVGDFPREIH